MVNKELAQKYKELELENISLIRKEADFTFEKKAGDYSYSNYFERKKNYKDTINKLDEKQEKVESTDAQDLLMKEVDFLRKNYRQSLKHYKEEFEKSSQPYEKRRRENAKKWIEWYELALSKSDDELASKIIERSAHTRDRHVARIKSRSLASAIGLRGENYDDLWCSMNGKIDIKKFNQLTQEEIQAIAELLKKTKYIEDFGKINTTETSGKISGAVFMGSLLAGVGSLLTSLLADTSLLLESVDSTSCLVTTGICVASAIASVGIYCLSGKLNEVFSDKQQDYVFTLDEVFESLGLFKENEEEMAD